MRHRYAIAVAAIATFVSAPCQGQEHEATYLVTQRGGGLGIWIDETVAFSLSPEYPQWIAERTRRDSNWCGREEPGKNCIATTKDTHDWIDGASCPELLRTLQALAAVDVVGFVDPTRMDLTTVSDTPVVEISGPSPDTAGYGASLMVSAYSGPFVDWWRESEERLETCWTTHAIDPR